LTGKKKVVKTKYEREQLKKVKRKKEAQVAAGRIFSKFGIGM